MSGTEAKGGRLGQMISERKRGSICGQGKFIIDVKYMEHSTWQGEVIWVDKGKKCCFRSALELIKIIDHTLDSVAGSETR